METTKLVLNYFNRTAMVGSVEEAVSFVNSLQYRSNGQAIVCNAHTEALLKDAISGGIHPVNFPLQIATTGCGVTRIMAYLPLADTLEEHNSILNSRKEKEAAERAEREARMEKEFISDMSIEARGWYVVTLDVLVSKFKGNDGTKTYSFRVLANSKLHAYETAVKEVHEKGVNDKNVCFVYHVQSSERTALIEFVGTWTDESEEEYGPEVE